MQLLALQALSLRPGGANAAPVSDTNCAKVSTPGRCGRLGGNVFGDEQGQAGKLSATNVVDRDGSLELVTTEQTPATGVLSQCR